MTTIGRGNRQGARAYAARPHVMALGGRALLAWVGLLAGAFANGAVRELALLPRMGETVAYAISCLTLSALILALSWWTIAWIDPRSMSEAWAIGGLWLALTLTFELLVGHYVFGDPWSRLWADYDVLHGRIWVVVLITTLVAPAVAARARGLWAGDRREVLS